jgi:hypothetical protein
MVEELYQRLQDIDPLVEALDETITEGKAVLLTEGVTYYNLRQFLTLMYRSTSDSSLKGSLLEILKVLARLEVLNRPVPTIKKLTTNSPEIFG